VVRTEAAAPAARRAAVATVGPTKLPPSDIFEIKTPVVIQL